MTRHGTQRLQGTACGCHAVMRPSMLFTDKLSSTASTAATAAAVWPPQPPPPPPWSNSPSYTGEERGSTTTHHHHQHTSCRTIVNTFTSPDNLDFFNLYLQYLMFSDYQHVSIIINTLIFSRSTYRRCRLSYRRTKPCQKTFFLTSELRMSTCEKFHP